MPQGNQQSKMAQRKVNSPLYAIACLLARQSAIEFLSALEAPSSLQLTDEENGDAPTYKSGS
jgi:hypothetical protein